MGNFNKIIRHIKTPIILSRKVVHRLPNGLIKRKVLNFPSHKKNSRMLDEIISNNKGKVIYIFPSPSCPWGYMFQRPQQIARTLAEGGDIVIYLTDTSYPYKPDWSVRGFFEVEPRIYLFNNGTDNFIHNLAGKDVVVWQYWPHQLKYVQCLKEKYPVIHIYDVIDDITTFDGYNTIKEDYTQSLNTADIVLATSKVILNNVSKIRQDVISIPNGVQVKDFNKPLSEINALSTMNNNYKLVVGYYGAIAEWFDFELLNKLSGDFPEIAFIMVGEIYKEVENEVGNFEAVSNVFFLKRINYEFIPSLLTYYDVAIIPFVINDITLSTSPVKVFEYLAGGKEVVSTDLPEVRSIDESLVACSHLEFKEKLELALKRKNDLSRKAYLKSIAEQHTWEQRVSRVTHEIEKRRLERNYENRSF
ncbi:hypothetical protein [Paenibacillus silagei]|uniref:Glycosyltransferase involved in cell wall biosynthesis n=1 Tax=Paenibacillus silagei TaxID=1670801 RepID=A0ABS4NKE0_9BACL|nr:hypothetical protein [Paenibacillus silagei]MBP2109885.1 glycosyltransferase involved in cell wall biosynthesis [Paenibacillus silagei]